MYAAWGIITAPDPGGNAPSKIAKAAVKKPESPKARAEIAKARARTAAGLPVTVSRSILFRGCIAAPPEIAPLRNDSVDHQGPRPASARASRELPTPSKAFHDRAKLAEVDRGSTAENL